MTFENPFKELPQLTGSFLTRNNLWDGPEQERKYPQYFEENKKAPKAATGSTGQQKLFTQS